MATKIVTRIVLGLIAAAGIMNCTFAGGELPAQFKVAESLDIAEVPAGFPVRFCLLTVGETQVVAYYDKQRRMTVASRSLDSHAWQYQVLPSQVGWDSHNYITMAVDGDGHLHLSGNMHCVPLVFFRTEKPGDITTLQKFPMIGNTEQRCTYPAFLRDADNRMIFHYRDGGSGNGNEIYNVYDLKTLRPLKKKIEVAQEYPGELGLVQSSVKGMRIRRTHDSGDSGDSAVRYILQWETLGTNRDRPRKAPLPQPSMLRLYKLTANDPS